MRRFVVVGGLARSGTSLTRRILDGHSQIAMLPGECKLLHRIEEGESVRWILARRQERRPELDLSDLLDCEPRDAYLALLVRHAERSGKPICGEKSPRNEFFYHVLEDWFRDLDLRFVHLVRNPFDAAASHKYASFREAEKGREDPSARAEFAHRWKHSVAAGVCRSRRTPSRYSLLRYEALVSDPVAAVEGLCEFVGVEFEEKMLSLPGGIREHGRKGNSSFRWCGVGTRRVRGEIYEPESRQRFLSEREKEVIQACCGDLAATLGYLRELT